VRRFETTLYGALLRGQSKKRHPDALFSSEFLRKRQALFMFVLGDITKALRVLLVVPAPFLADTEDKHLNILEFVSKGLMLLSKLW